MPVPLPNLDDRNFDDLVEEGKRLIPSLAPSWTDHNPSDPGITFIELFAFITEMLLYRADRVTEANKEKFVKLLRGEPKYTITKPIEEEIRLAVRDLRDEQRAVTSGDFKNLAEALDGVGRAHCVPRRNVESRTPEKDDPAHVSLLIIPSESSEGQPPVPSEDLKTLIRNDLIDRCLLTTRLHVAAPTYLWFAVNMVVYVFADQDERDIKSKIHNQLARHFHPLSGGPDGNGWPFGQSVYVSDLYAILDIVDGVDYVEPNGQEPVFTITSPHSINRKIIENLKTIGLRLEPHELVWFEQDKSTIKVVSQAFVKPGE